MKKIILSILFLLLSSSVLSGEFFPIYGIYYDDLLEGSVEVGGFYEYERIEKEVDLLDGSTDIVFDYAKFLYLEGESNGKDTAATLGLGRHFGFGSIRTGISVADVEDEMLVGLESVFTALFFSLKVGAYRNQDTDSIEGMLGLGLSITGGL